MEPCELCGTPIQNIRLESTINNIAFVDFQAPPGPIWYEVMPVGTNAWEYQAHTPERCSQMRK